MRLPGRSDGRQSWQHSAEFGSAIVELALVFTVFFLLIGLVVQGAFVFSGWQVITNAVRQGARYGAPCIDRPVQPCYLTEADGAGTPNVHDVVIQAAQGIDRSQLTVGVTKSEGYLTVSASYPVPILAPFVGEIMPDGGFSVTAETVMRLEHADFP